MRGSDKCAMAAIGGLDESDVRISRELLPRFGGDFYKGIICGVQDERGHGDSLDDVSSGGAVIVVVDSLESAIESSHLIVKLAQAADAAQAGRIEMSGKKTGFLEHAAAKSPQKVLLVNAVGGFMQGVGRRREIDRGTTHSNRAQLRRSLRSPLAREFQNDVSTHREADEREMRNAVVRDDLSRNGSNVSGKTGMIKHGSKVVGAAAVALVETDDVHSSSQSLFGDAEHVLGIARTFEAVHDDDGESARAIGLPVTVAEHFDAGLDFDEALLGAGQMKAARDHEAGKGLDVSAAEPAARRERTRVLRCLRSPHSLILNRRQ